MPKWTISPPKYHYTPWFSLEALRPPKLDQCQHDHRGTFRLSFSCPFLLVITFCLLLAFCPVFLLTIGLGLLLCRSFWRLKASLWIRWFIGISLSIFVGHQACWLWWLAIMSFLISFLSSLCLEWTCFLCHFEGFLTFFFGFQPFKWVISEC